MVLVVAATSLLLTQNANAQSVTATVSTDTVRVAEPFSFDVTVKAPAGSKVTLPSVEKQIGEFDIIETDEAFDIPAAEISNERTWNKHFVVESIATGDQTIPSLDVQVTTNGESVVLQTQPLTVHVASVLENRADPTQFRDIRGVVDGSVPELKSYRWAWYSLGGTGAGALALLGIAWAGRRRSWETPHDWASQQLKELSQVSRAPGVDTAEATSALSNIVREYLHFQFAIDMTGQTSDQLVDQVAAKRLVDPPALSKLKSVFNLADQSKFAGKQLTHRVLESTIGDTRDLVDSITQQCNRKWNNRTRQSSDSPPAQSPGPGDSGHENKGPEAN